jgi:hypothetical protein
MDDPLMAEISATYVSTTQASRLINQSSTRTRNEAKDLSPILLHNADPNALYRQQLGFIPWCGRGDTLQSSIAENPERRNPPALGFAQSPRAQCLLDAVGIGT